MELATFGQRLRSARKASELTQAQVAAAVGIKQSTISEMEIGDSASSGYTARLAALLKVHALWLETGKGLRHLVGLEARYDAQTLEVAELFHAMDPQERINWLLGRAKTAHPPRLPEPDTEGTTYVHPKKTKKDQEP